MEITPGEGPASVLHLTTIPQALNSVDVPGVVPTLLAHAAFGVTLRGDRQFQAGELKANKRCL